MSAVRAGKLPLILIFLAIAWATAGCSHTQHVGSARTVRMGLTEYRLDPQSVHLSGAGKLAIIVHNYGRLTHDLVVSANGQSVAGTKPIPPGQTVELDLDLAPGNYLMASTVLSDQALGAYGTLTVG